MVGWGLRVLDRLLLGLREIVSLSSRVVGPVAPLGGRVRDTEAKSR